MSINENLLNEKINQLKKGLEIIGADKNYIVNLIVIL